MIATLSRVVLAAGLGALLAGCNGEGPCLEGGEDGECRSGDGALDPEVLHCAPSDEPITGTQFTCQGEGTGWFVTDVVGMGEQTACVSYAVTPAPANPSPADCGPIPLDAIPFDIPEPIACCTGDVGPGGILDTCVADCSYVACKIAIAKIRESAAGLQAPKGMDNTPYKRARADLYAYANALENPDGMDYCAKKVAAGAGQIVSIALGEGSSKRNLIGHIKSATLYLSCALDVEQPYVFVEDAGFCEEASNIPYSDY